MKNNVSVAYAAFLALGDFLAILFAFILAYIFRVSLDPRPLISQIPSIEYFKIFMFLLPFWVVIFAILGLYRREVYEKRFSEYPRLLLGTFIGVLYLIGYDFVSGRHIFPARLVAVYALLISYGLLLFFRVGARLLRTILLGFGYGVSNALIVGDSPANRELIEALHNTSQTGFRITGIVAKAAHVPTGTSFPRFDSFSEAIDKLKTDNLQCIIQTHLFPDQDLNRKILATAQTHHIAYRFVPANDYLYTANNEVELFRGFPVISVHQTALIGWGRVVKRLFDVLSSLIAIIVFSPVLLIVSIAIKLTDPKGPVLFKHKRLTRFGTTVTILKFRSMYWKWCGQDAVPIFEKMGRPDLVQEFIANRSKVKNDPRITPVGKFIRATSLDELPQLFNILRGDISLVGPRSIPGKELEGVKEKTPLLLSVKTGLTGLAQVSGRSDISFDERIALDLYYVQHWSFWMDIVIILKTIKIVLSGKGSA